MNYKEIFEDILEYDERFVAIIGCGDLIKSVDAYLFENLKEDDFWIIIGRSDNKSILEELNQCEFKLEKEGEYEFKILLKYYSGDWSVGESGYYEIVHDEFKFIQTFIEREREYKLSTLLDNDIFEI